jgi:outer membrane lipoprotein SlyB
MRKEGKAMPRGVFLLLAFLVVSLLAGCATQRPVLYPNEQLKQGGNEKAQADIDACMRLAKESGATSNVDERIAKQTAGGAVVGGVSGAVLGTFWGALGRGGLIGAAAGAAGGLTRGLIQADEPDALFRNFVNRCLRGKGYEPIGWK